jgi:PAS domain S-box-containing protein
VCREVLSIGRSEACCLVLCPEDPDSGPLRHVYVPSESSDPRPAYRPGPEWDALVDRLVAEPLIFVSDVRNLAPDDPIAALYARYPVRSALLLPLKFGSRLLGVLALHTFSAPGCWLDADLATLELAAPILSAALERRRMEGKLRASEAQYRFLAEHANDFISLHDLSGRCLYASPSVHGMAGIRPEVLVGSPLAAFLHPDDAAAVAEESAKLASGGARTSTLHYRMRRRDGGYLEVETVSSAVPDPDGQVRRILRVTRDLSGRKALERRLSESRNLEAVGLLAGGVAHEFNNLLVGINGSIEMLSLLLSGNPEALSYLDMIARLGDRAVELTHQLLAYARQGKYAPVPMSLNKVVSESVPVLKASLAASIDLSLSLPEGLPPVMGDVAQVKQVVMSLCLNAAEAMPAGGTLSIRTRLEDGTLPGAMSAPPRGTLRPGSAVECPRVALEVSDTGCGMDEATLDRIFDPFFSTKFVGRGMGLAAVRGIVESHQGGIAVESEPGSGTRFTIRLPAVQLCVLEPPEKPAPEAATPEAAAPEAGKAGGGGLVLVADDEEDVRRVVRAMLESLGHEVVEAADGASAVRIFRERHAEIELVLLDLMMPKMTGDLAFAEMRRIDPSVKALLASGYDESGRVGDILANGFGGFLQKPFRRRDLGRKIASILASGRAVV